MKIPLLTELGAARGRRSEKGRIKQDVTAAPAAAKGVMQIKIFRCLLGDEPVSRSFNGKRSAHSFDEFNVRGCYTAGGDLYAAGALAERVRGLARGRHFAGLSGFFADFVVAFPAALR